MKKNYLLIAFICLSACACGSNTSSPSNQAAQNNAASQTQAVTNMSKTDRQIADAQKKNVTSGIVQPKYYPGTGAITQLNKKTGEVELDHGEIPDKMPAGKNKFKVRLNEYIDFLKDLKVGDKVNFIVEDDSGTIHVSSISKQHPSQK